MNDENGSWAAVVVGIIVAAVILAFSSRSCTPAPEPVPPAPETPVTPTATATFPAPPPTWTPTATARATVNVPTWTPVPPTATATVGAPTATATISPASETPTPSPTPIVLRGRVRVKAGDTLWDISCREYGGMRLRPRANPLTPCTCWPGIALASRLDHPRLILPGQRLDVPRACIQ